MITFAFQKPGQMTNFLEQNMIIKRDYYINQLIASKHFKKIIIVKDHIKPKRNQEGIVTIGLIDFLLNPELLNWQI